MSFSLLVHAAAGAATDPTTSAIDTTGANLIIISVSQYAGSAIGSLSDNKSNTWTGLTAQAGNATGGNQNQYCRLFYCYAPTVGAGHTFKWTGTNVFGTICVAAFSGSASSPFDQQNGAFGNVPGSVTPSVDSELVVSAVSFGSPATELVDSSLTITDKINYVSGGAEGGALAYIIQTTAGAVNPTWSGGSGSASVIATFKAAGGATIVPWAVIFASSMRVI